ncbi:MAG: hypothetical protein JWR81_6884 [Pseudonocardia sp.]|jgi:hypothetical protein|nr:hypothetical protein [Pseudonocardia sp.]
MTDLMRLEKKIPTSPRMTPTNPRMMPRMLMKGIYEKGRERAPITIAVMARPFPLGFRGGVGGTDGGAAGYAVMITPNRR